MKFEAIVFDLFNTLLHFNFSLLPEVEFSGQTFYTTTVEVYRRLKEEFRVKFSFDRFFEEFQESRQIITEMREKACREFPSRRRFEILQERLGQKADAAVALMVEVHMGEMFRIMYSPSEKGSVMEKLRGYPLILVSNFDHALTARRALKAFRLEERFEKIFISDEVGWRKPGEKFFEIVTERSGINPERCLYVGDDPIADVYGAGRRGFQVAWLVETDHAVTPPIAPRWTIHNLSEVLTLVEGSEARGVGGES